jgi:uncharacterized membrane protein SpoIIM required for sporulation
MKKTLAYIFDAQTLNKIYFLAILFILAIIIGFFFGDVVYKPVPNSLHEERSNILQLLRKFFFNNYFVALIMVFFGYFSAGIITTAVMVINGLTFGYGLNYLNINRIGGILGVIKRLIFHTPLEIFALCLMGSLGLRGFDLVIGIIKTKDFTLNQILITKQMVYQYFTGTFLLFIAALIESLVSKII